MTTFEYIIIRKKVRGVSLRVYPDLQVKVTVPISLPLPEVEKWVESKKEWVLTKLAHFSQIVPPPIPESLTVTLLGEVIQTDMPLSKRESLVVWYKQQAKKYLIPRLIHLADYHGFRFQKVFIRDTQTKWGSCSSLHNIGLNYRLVKAPWFVIDYVIIHELCHTVHFNHSKAFWDTVGQHCPDYEIAKKWLKTEGVTIE